jgi:PAS domain S-box-containing protein
MNEHLIQILAVDDDKALCVLTKEILETCEDLKVDSVNSVREAMVVLSSRQYDAIVSDYQMPEENGIELLKELREKGDNTPFVLFTGKGREDVVIEAFDNGADFYVQKGTETRTVFAELEHKVRKAVNRVRTETALLESEYKYRMMAENMADVITVMDLDLERTYVSPSIIDQTGYSLEEALKQSALEILTPESLNVAKKAMSEELERKFDSGSPLRCTRTLELEEYRKDGQTVWISAAVRFMRDENGKPVSIIIISHGITEKRAADDALMNANHKLSLLSSITRHDILNQLQVLTGWIGLLDSPNINKEVAKKRTMTAAKNVEELIQFTGEYERLGSTEPRFIGIRKEISKIADNITLVGIEIMNELQDEEVMAYPLLNKVFYNLLENTSRHSEKATYIRFRTEVVDGTLDIICEDDGVGILGEEKELIFERGQGKHYGLGLFFAREILSITGITICENGASGEGSRFVIAVPRGKWRREGRT